MSETKNPKTENEKNEKNKNPENDFSKNVIVPKMPMSILQMPPVKNPAPDASKSDRLDRMEEQLKLIEAGLLALVNSAQWSILSITPIGTHNPNLYIQGYNSLQEAVEELKPRDGEQIGQ